MNGCQPRAEDMRKATAAGQPFVDKKVSALQVTAETPPVASVTLAPDFDGYLFAITMNGSWHETLCPLMRQCNADVSWSLCVLVDRFCYDIHGFLGTQEDLFANRRKTCLGCSGASNLDCSKRRDSWKRRHDTRVLRWVLLNAAIEVLKVRSDACGSLSRSQQTSPLATRTTSSSGSADMLVGSSRDFTCRLVHFLLTSDSKENLQWRVGRVRRASLREGSYLASCQARRSLDWTGNLDWHC